jgi:CBS domain-containing protein
MAIETSSTTGGRSAPPAPATALTIGSLVRSPAPMVEPDAHVASAAYLMKRAGSCAVVVDGADLRSGPVTVITDTDIAQAVADGLSPDDTRVRKLRLPGLEPLRPDTTIEEAARAMVAVGKRQLPVRDSGAIIGLVDLLAVCDALLGAAPNIVADPNEGFRNMGG